MQLEIFVVGSAHLGEEGMVCHLTSPSQSQGLCKDTKQGFWKRLGVDRPVLDGLASFSLHAVWDDRPLVLPSTDRK